MTIRFNPWTNRRHDGESVAYQNLGFDRADEIFRQDEHAALSGSTTLSAETMPMEWNSTVPLLNLATDSPDRFLHLISHLTPILEDIFIQYYLMGRTYAQIGALLFPSRGSNAAEIQVKTGHRIGVDALCVYLRTRGRISRLGQRSAMRGQWARMLEWQRSTARRPLRIRLHDDLGEFVVHPNGQLDELFAPSWSVLGRAGKG